MKQKMNSKKPLKAPEVERGNDDKLKALIEKAEALIGKPSPEVKERTYKITKKKCCGITYTIKTYDDDPKHPYLVNKDGSEEPWR